MINNKNGFTMIELLATVTLLLIVATILIPSIMSVSDNVKETQYNSQIELILAGAKEYGQDNINMLNASSCTNISVGYLVELGYIKADSDDKLEVINPKTNESMNEMTVCIKYEKALDENIEGTTKYHYKVTTSIVE